MKANKKQSNQVRVCDPGQTKYGSGSIGKITGDFGRYTVADLYHRDPVAACRRALEETRNLPENDRMEKINTLLETCGTEAIRGEWQNGYWCDIVAVYCNTGDTYDTTVLQVRGDTSQSASRFMITSWGDFVEHHGRRYGIQ
jgi:hypothetical protein